MAKTCACGKATGNDKFDKCPECNKKAMGEKNAPKEPQFDVKITYKYYPTDKLNANNLLEVNFLLTITNQNKIKSGCPVVVMKSGIVQKAIDPSGGMVDIGATNIWGQTSFTLGFTEKELGQNIELEAQARYPETVSGKTVEGLGFETIRFTLPPLVGIKKGSGKKEKCKHCGGAKTCTKDEIGGVKCSCKVCLTADGTKDRLATVSCSFCK